MEPEDLDLLYQIENDKNLWGVGATNVPYSRYVLHDYVANSSGDIYTDKQVRLMVDCQQQTIGIVDLINFFVSRERTGRDDSSGTGAICQDGSSSSSVVCGDRGG